MFIEPNDPYETYRFKYSDSLMFDIPVKDISVSVRLGSNLKYAIRNAMERFLRNLIRELKITDLEKRELNLTNLSESAELMAGKVIAQVPTYIESDILHEEPSLISDKVAGGVTEAASELLFEIETEYRTMLQALRKV